MIRLKMFSMHTANLTDTLFNLWHGNTNIKTTEKELQTKTDQHIRFESVKAVLMEVALTPTRIYHPLALYFLHPPPDS